VIESRYFLTTTTLRCSQDALSILSAVVSSNREDTEEILDLIGAHCSGKELLIAVQECAEHLLMHNDAENTVAWSPILQLVRLMRVYQAGAVAVLSF
jgi:hypothetical protein